MKEVLLHCCCAPCSSAIIEWMLAHDVRPVLYYCNPNIFPEEEYYIRKNELTRYAQQLGLCVIDEDYDHADWLSWVKGFEAEPERGGRCLMCFKYRLLRSAKKCRELGFSEFTTTLASSRWKRQDQIDEAGLWAAAQVPGTTFDTRNWRKGGLQERRNQLLRENGFYNQQYCGCEFSFRTPSPASNTPNIPPTESCIQETVTDDTAESIITTAPMTRDVEAKASPILQPAPASQPAEEEDEASKTLNPALVAALHRLIEEEKVFLRPDFHIDDLAQRLGTNRTYVTRMMRLEYGLSFNEYVNVSRVQYSQQLLYSSDLVLDEVAARSGFLSTSNYCRVFRRYMGDSPLVWIQKVKG